MKLTADERGELEAVIRKRSGSAALARRARCVLLWADGERRVDIRAKLACNDAFVTRWTKAFELQGLAGLVSLHPGRAPVRHRRDAVLEPLMDPVHSSHEHGVSREDGQHHRADRHQTVRTLYELVHHLNRVAVFMAAQCVNASVNKRVQGVALHAVELPQHDRAGALAAGTVKDAESIRARSTTAPPSTWDGQIARSCWSRKKAHVRVVFSNQGQTVPLSLVRPTAYAEYLRELLD